MSESSQGQINLDVFDVLDTLDVVANWRKTEAMWNEAASRMASFDIMRITGYRLVQTRNGARIVFLFEGFEDMPEMPTDFTLSRRRAHRLGKRMTGARLCPTSCGTADRVVDSKGEVTIQFHWADLNVEG